MLHLHRFHREQRLAGNHHVTDLYQNSQDRPWHRRDRRPESAGVVGRRIPRWNRESVLATRDEDDITVDPTLSVAAIMAFWRRRFVAGIVTVVCIGITLMFMLGFSPDYVAWLMD